MKSLTPSVSRFLKFLIISLLVIQLAGCGVSASQKEEIQQAISKVYPNFEANTKLLISGKKGFTEINLGEWKWVYEKDVGRKYLVTFGYFGRPPLWKAALGLVIGSITLLITFGYFFYDPFVSENIAIPLLVDLDNGSVVQK